jgi:hypothetical protein
MHHDYDFSFLFPLLTGLRRLGQDLILRTRFLVRTGSSMGFE